MAAVFLSSQLDDLPERRLRMESSLSLQLLSELFITLYDKPFSVWYLVLNYSEGLNSDFAGKAELFGASNDSLFLMCRMLCSTFCPR